MNENMRICLEWLFSEDTGVSSKTMCAAYLGIKPTTITSVPYDAADFGRCYRFLKRFPNPKGVAEHIWYEFRNNPAWTEIGKNWDKLTDLYEKEKYKEIYEVIQSILTKVRENTRKEQAEQKDK